MVKRTRFRRHPVHIYQGLMFGPTHDDQDYAGGFQLDTQDAAVLSASGQDDSGWSLLSLAAQNPPFSAIAAVLDIQVNDSGGAAEDCHMRVATPGIIVAGKTQYIPTGHINDMIGNKLCIVELSDDFKFAYMIQASGAAFDYNILLVGWILDPSVTKLQLPNEELKAIFEVSGH